MPNTPQIPDGTSLYNAIMQEIDTDLITDNIPLLRKKYAGETPEEAKKRSARYEAAFTEYDKRYMLAIQNLNVEVQKYRRDALHSAEAMSIQNDVRKLEEIENAFTVAV